TCSNPAARDGTACSDGNSCTQTDTCQSGVCTGQNPVVCTASDACHLAGSCNPSTGTCSNPTAPDGTGCSDGNPCTHTDTCRGGATRGAQPAPCRGGPCAGQTAWGGPAPEPRPPAARSTPSPGVCDTPPTPAGPPCDDATASTLTAPGAGGLWGGSTAKPSPA